ncbi:MAG: flagellin [Alphaproteobacteria bacterium]|nr:flagellin [Alphaproteobacteria bacterium SS10]
MSTEQREIYTDDLRAQVDQLRSFIENAEYNGRNILAGDQGTFGDAFTGYSAAESVNAIRNIDGQSLQIRANDLVLGTGGSSGVTGFVGLARIVYSTDTTDGGSDGLTGNDTTASNAVAANSDGNFVARSLVNARVAQAALAGLNDDGTRAADAFRSADTETQGTQSVFNSAFSFFEQEISNALGQLGADNRSIELQLEFNTSLNDATTEGLGNLVDADLARESARLQALQTRQQLSIQALSIANQQPTNVLALFN